MVELVRVGVVVPRAPEAMATAGRRFLADGPDAAVSHRGPAVPAVAGAGQSACQNFSQSTSMVCGRFFSPPRCSSS